MKILAIFAALATLIGASAAGAQAAPAHPQFVDYQSALSRALQADQNQDLATALVSYVQALQADPNSGTPRADLFQMITQYGMPHVLTDAQQALLQQNSAPFTLSTPSAGILLLGLSGAAGASLDSVSDPQNQWPFPALCAVYASDTTDPTQFDLVCSVHYQVSGDQDFSQHVGRLLALLKQTLIRRTGQEPAYQYPFNVWLSRSASVVPGGEQWRNNIYLYNIGDNRSSIEWIREIAHEYGHLAIPPLGGDYTSPEAWANGYVGERLMVRWLADPNLAGQSAVEAAWGRTFEGYPNFKAKLIDPPLALFISVGLDKAMLARKDALGMRYLIGMLLWIDEYRGGHALGDLLWNMNTPAPTELYKPAQAMKLPTAPHAMHTQMVGRQP